MRKKFISDGKLIDNLNYINVEQFIENYKNNKSIMLDGKNIKIKKYFVESQLFYDKTYSKHEEHINLPLPSILSKNKMIDQNNLFCFDFDKKQNLGYFYYDVETVNKNGKKVLKIYRKTKQETIKIPEFKTVRKKYLRFSFYHRGKKINKSQYLLLTKRQQNNVIISAKEYFRNVEIITGYKTKKIRTEIERFYKIKDKKVQMFDIYVPYFLFMRSTYKKAEKGYKSKNILQFYIGTYAVAPAGQKLQGHNTQRGEIHFNPILNNQKQIKVNPDLFTFSPENKLSLLDSRLAEIFYNLGIIKNEYVKKMFRVKNYFTGNTDSKNINLLKGETSNLGYDDRIRLDEKGEDISKKYFPFLDFDRIRADKEVDSYFVDIPIEFMFFEGRNVDEVFDEDKQQFTSKVKFLSVLNKDLNNHFTIDYLRHIKINELGRRKL